MLATDLLRQNAQLYPDTEALIAVESKGLQPFDDASYLARRKAYTWRDFDKLANQVANYYRSIGIGRGNKISIIMMNCAEWLPIYFGVLRSGATAVPLNFRYHEEDIIRSVHFAEVDAMIVGPHCRDIVGRCLDQISRVKSFIFVGSSEECPAYASTCQETFATVGTEAPDIPLSPDDDAAIYFSSGTTGTPKAVMYTHGTLREAWKLEYGNHQQRHEDTFVLIPPLYHVGGKLHWMGNLPVGARCVMLLGFNVTAFFEVMRREHISISFLLLPWVQDILFHLDSGLLDLSQYDTSSWRMLHMGSQPIPPSIVRQMQGYFPDIVYEVSYGLTESGGPGCMNLSHTRTDKMGSVGLPSPGWTAKIIDSDGNEVPRGQPGELLMKGPGITKGYYKNPEMTAKTIRDGWLYTGDLAKQDEDGFYYIVGRIKDIIICGGENVYPVPIEVFIRKHPAVQDVAVFGIADCRLGETVAAQIELKDGAVATEEEMMAFCQDLPRFQRPRKIFIGEVPRNPTGKIDKNVLRKRHSPENPFENHAHT